MKSDSQFLTYCVYSRSSLLRVECSFFFLFYINANHSHEFRIHHTVYFMISNANSPTVCIILIPTAFCGMLFIFLLCGALVWDHRLSLASCVLGRPLPASPAQNVPTDTRGVSENVTDDIQSPANDYKEVSVAKKSCSEFSKKEVQFIAESTNEYCASVNIPSIVVKDDMDEQMDGQKDSHM